MDDATRQLRYLPLFHQDLDQATEYIAHTLGNPKAALDLLDSVESAILERLPVAESFEPYPSRTVSRRTTGFMSAITSSIMFC